MKTVLLTLVTALVVALAPAVANAGGGGGTKATVKITVRNNTGQTVGVIVNANAAALAAIDAAIAGGTLTAQEAAALQAKFKQLGGQVLTGAQTATFANIKAGPTTVDAIVIDGAGSVSARANFTTNTTKGTLKLSVTGTADPDTAAIVVIP